MSIRPLLLTRSPLHLSSFSAFTHANPALKRTFKVALPSLASKQHHSTMATPITYEKEPRHGFPQERFLIDQPVAPGSYLGPVDPTLPGADKIPRLFQPFTVKNLTIANRVVVAPMCMYSSKDGFMTSFHLAHLGSFAINGAGLILAEATAVEPR